MMIVVDWGDYDDDDDDTGGWRLVAGWLKLDESKEIIMMKNLD